jgi:hypothetical protein
MKPLIRVTLLCFVTLGLLIWGSVLIGHAQPRPEFFGALGRCEGLPCYVGIVPGQTRWADVQTRFEIVTELRGDNHMYLAYAPPGFSGTLRFFPSGDGLLREVDLRFSTTGLKIGDLIAEMGVPCAVGITTRGLPVVVYPSMGVLVAGERMGEAQLVKLTSTVTGINLLRDPDCSLVNSLALHTWRGFGRYTA